MDIGLAIVERPSDGAILIARRKENVHLGGYWEFPGGKFAVGETAPECAVREAREEVGLDVVPTESWPVITFTYPERTVTLHPVLCVALTDNALARESSEIAWVAPADLPGYPFPEANAPLIVRLMER